MNMKHAEILVPYENPCVKLAGNPGRVESCSRVAGQKSGQVGKNCSCLRVLWLKLYKCKWPLKMQNKIQNKMQSRPLDMMGLLQTKGYPLKLVDLLLRKSRGDPCSGISLRGWGVGKNVDSIVGICRFPSIHSCLLSDGPYESRELGSQGSGKPVLVACLKKVWELTELEMTLKEMTPTLLLGLRLTAGWSQRVAPKAASFSGNGKLSLDPRSPFSPAEDGYLFC